jgi:hypothetical protein
MRVATSGERVVEANERAASPRAVSGGSTRAQSTISPPDFV